MGIQTINLTDAVGTTGREKINSNFQELDSDLGDKAGLSSNNTFTGIQKTTAQFETESANPKMLYKETDAPTNESTWFWDSQGGNFRLRGANDAFSAGYDYLTVNRSGVNVDSWVFHEGNVGIGTTSPSGKLEILSTSTSASNYAQTITNTSGGRGLKIITANSDTQIGVEASEGQCIRAYDNVVTSNPLAYFYRDNSSASGPGLWSRNDGSGSPLRLTGLPTSPAGLSSGDMWRSGEDAKFVV